MGVRNSALSRIEKAELYLLLAEPLPIAGVEVREGMLPEAIASRSIEVSLWSAEEKAKLRRIGRMGIIVFRWERIPWETF
jgi:hypothetical protein